MAWLTTWKMSTSADRFWFMIKFSLRWVLKFILVWPKDGRKCSLRSSILLNELWIPKVLCSSPVLPGQKILWPVWSMRWVGLGQRESVSASHLTGCQNQTSHHAETGYWVLILCIQMVAPYHDACLEAWIKAYDVFSLHVYFTAAHRNIRCWAGLHRYTPQSYQYVVASETALAHLCTSTASPLPRA